MLDYPPYDSLIKIEPHMLIEKTETINQSFSENTVPIPTRIESINLLRSIHKFQSSFFFEVFGALRSKFLKNCLHYEQNTHLQQISLNFLTEIFDDDTYGVSNETVYDLYYDIFQFMESNDINLKKMAKTAIKTMSEKVVCDAKIIVLIESLKNSDDNLCAFIFESFKNAMENLRGYIYLNYNFNDIFEKLNLEEVNDEDYIIKIKQIFQILKKSLDSSDEVEIYNSLTDKYKNLYRNLTSQ